MFVPDTGPRRPRPYLGAPPGLEVFLVGIDDTDNLESRGTGFHSRQLADVLHAERLAEVLDITRHQLLFDPRIPYTSHNSSLCLRVRTAAERAGALAEACRAYLLAESAPGSDAGLCILSWPETPSDVEAFGALAKVDVLTLDRAVGLAKDHKILLEGLTGDHGGMIGALAAVGLRRSGRDGRIAWRPGIRETSGVITAADLVARTGIEAVRQADGGQDVAPDDRIDIQPWARAVMMDGQAILLVEKADEHDEFSWRLASRDILRRY